MASSGEACPVCKGTSNSTKNCPLFPAWAMEAKMKYFFEDIKASQHVDPEVYSFWTTAIQHHLQQKKSFTFTHEETLLTYKRHEIVTALCIGRILYESEQHKDIAPLTLVSSINQPPSFPYARWALQKLLLAPVNAIWSYATGGGEYDDEDDAIPVTSYRASASDVKKPRVSVTLLRKAAQLIACYASRKIELERTLSLQGPSVEKEDGGGVDRRSGVFTWKDFCRAAAVEEEQLVGAGGEKGEIALIAGILKNISDQDSRVLADYMVGSGLAIRQGSYLKVIGPSSTTQKKKRGSSSENKITEADRRVLDFRINVNKIEASLSQKEKEMKAAKERATALYKQGLSHQARVELMRYKKLEELVTKLRTGVLNLLTIHYSIEGVGTDMEIFKGLKGGSEALEEQKAAGGLTIKDVDEAMEEVQHLISATQEVGTALAQPVSAEAATTAEEEADLLRELEALELGQHGAGVATPATTAVIPPSTATAKVPTRPTAGVKVQGEVDIVGMLLDISHLPPPVPSSSTRQRASSPPEKIAASSSSAS